MMKYLAILIVSVYMCTVVYKSVAYMVIYRWLKRTKSTDTSNEKKGYPYLVFLIPGLREQSVANETVEYFMKFKYPSDRLSVMIITTEKEMNQKLQKEKQLRMFYEEVSMDPRMETLVKKNMGIFPRMYLDEVLEILKSTKGIAAFNKLTELYRNVPTTAEVVADSIRRANTKLGYPLFYHVHYPYIHGGKPSQLNFAIEQLKSLEIGDGIPENDIYIGVYDFDSRPDLRTGLFIAGEVLKRKIRNEQLPAMFQQTQLPLNNLSRLPGGVLENALLRGNAILYIRRALGIELFKIKTLGRINEAKIGFLLKALLRPIVYGIGAGMYIRLDTLKKIKMFPEPQEDLAMGYRMCMLGEEILPIPYLNFMEPYDSYRQMLNAFSMTFISAIKVKEEKNITKDIKPRRVLAELEKNSLIIKEWIECLIWLLGLPLLWMSYIYLLLNLRPVGLTIVILSVPLFIRFYFDMAFLQGILLDLYSMYQGVEIKDAEIPFVKKMIIILTAPYQGIVRGIPPVKGIYGLFKKYILSRNVERTKTER